MGIGKVGGGSGRRKGEGRYGVVRGSGRAEVKHRRLRGGKKKVGRGLREERGVTVVRTVKPKGCE